MPKFSYEAYGTGGEFAAGNVEASSSESAEQLLWTRGLIPLQIRPVDQSDKPWWNRDLFTRERFSRSDLSAFTRELATMLAADVPLTDALSMVSESARSAAVRPMASRLLADVRGGSTLSAAMAHQAHAFAPDYVNMIQAGEIGGRLSQVIEELATLIEKRLELRAQIHSALLYPTILLVLTTVSLVITVGVLVPSISPLFVESAKAPPATLRVLMALHLHWPQILGVMAVIIVLGSAAIVLALRRPTFRLTVDRLKATLPIVGEFVTRQETARFTRTLGTLLRAGVPLLSAAASARTVVSNRHIAEGINGAIDGIGEGAPIHRALQDCAILAPMAVRMIDIGERTGMLDSMLLRAAGMFEQQNQIALDRLMGILTPMLTMLIAGLVGGLILTVLSAVLTLNDLVLR